jgi:phenylpyruvate tautomerase PptA (4-oxalocrotonate tautomerase family)
MPLVRISLVKGKPGINVPPGDIVYDSNYLGIARTSDLLVVQITLSVGRTLEQKRALYRRISAYLNAAVGLRPQDAWINLVEVAKENWSFGNGLASYAPAEAQTA